MRAKGEAGYELAAWQRGGGALVSSRELGRQSRREACGTAPVARRHLVGVGNGGVMALPMAPVAGRCFPLAAWLWPSATVWAAKLLRVAWYNRPAAPLAAGDIKPPPPASKRRWPPRIASSCEARRLPAGLDSSGVGPL